MWAEEMLESTIINILSDRFTHIFTMFIPVGWAVPTTKFQQIFS